MALPSTTISFADAGRLRIYLTGRYERSNSDVGFPNQSDGNVRLRAFVGPSGSRAYTSAIDKFNMAATIEVAYPGGSAVWDVGAEFVEGQAASGTVVVAMRDVRVSWELVKR